MNRSECNFARSDLGPAVEELWLHLSMHYQSPWRPTFTLLRRRGLRQGDDDATPLAVVDGSHGPGCCFQPVFLTLWEAISRVSLEAPIRLRAFRVLADGLGDRAFGVASCALGKGRHDAVERE